MRARAVWPPWMRSGILKNKVDRLGAKGPRDDVDVFLAAVADAKPLPPTPLPPSVRAKEKPAPIPLQRMQDEFEALQASRLSDMTPETLLESDEALSFARHGISSDTLRKLRRGHWSIQANLDLHGLRTDEAREAFVEFLKHCANKEIRCVRIIHGKGLGSVNKQPVLKGKVLAWLMQREEVLAYCQAPANDGGSGAVRVLLKQPRRPSRQF